MGGLIAAAAIVAACSAGGNAADGTDAAIAAIAAAPAELVSPPPEAYIRASDRERARRDDPADGPCTVHGILLGERYSNRLPTNQCVRMLPRQRFRGVWFNRFEVSVFWPGRENLPDEEPRMWLETEASELRTLPAERAYLLEFEGRRTAYPGRYGHSGYVHEIVVDRVISARMLD